MLKMFAFVAIGGAAGACARFAIVLVTASLFGTGFPLATMIVNVVGSFIMGVLVELSMERISVSDAMRGLLAIGMLGSFTTFSTFSLDAISLFEKGRTGAAATYVVLSVLLSISALIAGIWLARRF